MLLRTDDLHSVNTLIMDEILFNIEFNTTVHTNVIFVVTEITLSGLMIIIIDTGRDTANQARKNFNNPCVEL